MRVLSSTQSKYYTTKKTIGIFSPIELNINNLKENNVKQLIKFMVSYAAMLGTFCMYFFGVLAVEPMADKFSLSIMACILSVCALFLVNNVMMEIQERIKL